MSVGLDTRRSELDVNDINGGRQVSDSNIPGTGSNPKTDCDFN